MQNKTPESDAIFASEMQGVRPMAQDTHISSRRRSPDSLAKSLKRQALEKEDALEQNRLSIEYVDPVDPHDMLAYKKPGVQDGVYKNLRLAKYAIDTRLSLQQCNVREARDKLYETIVSCQERGIRVVLVQHGMGFNSKPFPALIKSYVNQWLRQLPQVLAFHSAQTRDGGYAAVYVLLQKSPAQKQENREIHSRR